MAFLPTQTNYEVNDLNLKYATLVIWGFIYGDRVQIKEKQVLGSACQGGFMG